MNKRGVSKYGRANKYNAQKVYRDGNVYDSKAEAEYAEVLKLLQAQGWVDSWDHHPPAVVVCGECGEKWKVDYKVVDYDKQEYYVEVKGLATQSYRNKLRKWKSTIPAPLFVVRKYGDMAFRVIESVGVGDIKEPTL